jgi:sterol desaturase/sphingolipid hydroxylase (fatty acid hydroxylase superfamily)
MPAWSYPAALAVISAVVAGLEALFPWRAQKRLRPNLASDVVYLVFNGHFLGLALAAASAPTVGRLVDAVSVRLGLDGWQSLQLAASWPLGLQIVVVLFGLDFIQWCVHVALHRVPGLWTFHQAHHSVVDGEMDWIVAFRFQWTEVVVYRAAQYLPLALMGFASEALFFHAVFGTLIGHLNHANLAWDYGPLRYLLNNPKMHLWHHDYDAEAGKVVNFGIIFSVWDYLFGTARVPDHPPRRIGFPGVESFPRGVFAQALFPWAPRRVAAFAGAGFLTAAVALAVL